MVNALRAPPAPEADDGQQRRPAGRREKRFTQRGQPPSPAGSGAGACRRGSSADARRARPANFAHTWSSAEVQVDHRVVALVVLPELVVVRGSGRWTGGRPASAPPAPAGTRSAGGGPGTGCSRTSPRRPAGGAGLDALLVARDGGRELAARELDVGQVVERDAVRRRRAQHARGRASAGVLVAARLLVLDGEQVHEVAVVGLVAHRVLEVPDRARRPARPRATSMAARKSGFCCASSRVLEVAGPAAPPRGWPGAQDRRPRAFSMRLM